MSAEAKQIAVKAGQAHTIQGGEVWVGLPAGSSFVTTVDGNVIVAAASEFNLVPINQPPPIQVSPTSPVTVQAGPAPTTVAAT